MEKIKRFIDIAYRFRLATFGVRTATLRRRINS